MPIHDASRNTFSSFKLQHSRQNRAMAPTREAMLLREPPIDNHVEKNAHRWRGNGFQGHVNFVTYFGRLPVRPAPKTASDLQTRTFPHEMCNALNASQMSATACETVSFSEPPDPAQAEAKQRTLGDMTAALRSVSERCFATDSYRFGGPGSRPLELEQQRQEYIAACSSQLGSLKSAGLAAINPALGTNGLRRTDHVGRMRGREALAEWRKTSPFAISSSDGGFLAAAGFLKFRSLEVNDETIDRWGYVHSGDKGVVDVDGFLRVTGRYKELLIGAGGENIAPVPIENALKTLERGVSNAMMIGDKRPYNCMLITLTCEGYTGEQVGSTTLTGPAKLVDPDCETVADAQKSKLWAARLDAVVTAVNKDGSCVVSNACKVQKWKILDHDFSVDGGELTSTLKLRRGEVRKAMADDIEGFYK